MKLTALTLACAALLGACASASPADMADMNLLAAKAQPAATSPGILKIVDEQRPDANESKASLALLQNSCVWGVVAMGKTGAAAERIPRLDRAVSDAFGPGAAGDTLRIRQYDVYFNDASVLADVVSAAVSGPVGRTADLASNSEKIVLRPKCAADKMSHGWFDTADLTNNNSPFVIEINVQFRGRDYVTRSAYSPPYGWTRPPMWDWNKPLNIAIIQAAMDKANARLIDAMKKEAPATAVSTAQ